MCGLVGFWNRETRVDGSQEALLLAMASRITRRGPDDCGVWFDEVDNIGFSHRRLAIVDLSSAGHQPMLSASGDLVIAFNGEIYNHFQLRQDLESSGFVYPWKGHSDTETLLACFQFFGVIATLKKVRGMFAFSLWDRRKKTLTLGRDRFGEKPLYYGWQKGCLLFGSEINALRSHPNFSSEINRDSLTQLLRHSYIPAPYSIYKGISKLAPGSILTFTPDAKEGVQHDYWSIEKKMDECFANRFLGNGQKAVDELERVLSETISQQSLADVSLGAFLSGGVDSSLIAALMQSTSPRPVKTFSIGFHEEGFNEAEYARAVAKHLNTDHHDMYVTSQDALNVIPDLPSFYDEPFSDSSQIPTYLVSKIAKEKVTVSLSGDAGDELFGGYSRYQLASSTWGRINSIPLRIRKVLANGVSMIPSAVLRGLLSPVDFALHKTGRNVNLADKILKAAPILGSSDVNEFYYRAFMSHNNDPSGWILNSSELDSPYTQPQRSFANSIEGMMYSDLQTYLQGDILTKVDRAAMANSLETRVPFLDKEVVEFAWRLPFEYKVNNGVGKWILKELLYRHVPRSLIERPKKGFGVPIGEWLRGPLKDWGADLLDERRLNEEGFFNVDLVRQQWNEHQTGLRNWQYQLWDVLMFQAWLRKPH